jgi:hypothetical protein
MSDSVYLLSTVLPHEAGIAPRGDVERRREGGIEISFEIDEPHGNEAPNVHVDPSDRLF